MIFNVGIDNLEEANKFLRKLWAEFRKEFEKCAWIYMPYKEGINNTINFGTMDIGIPEGALEVYIVYSKRGSIKTINFDFSERNIFEGSAKELHQKIQSIIDTSKSNYNQASKFFFKTEVHSLVASLGYYKGEAFCTEPGQENRFNITIATSGYDNIDAKTQCQSKMLQCLDLLSVETNCPFWLDNSASKIEQEADDEEIFMEDLEWIDGYPFISDKLRLSESGKKLIDLIANDELNKNIELFLRACNHFHTGRKYDAQINDTLKHSSIEEVKSGLYQINLEETDKRLTMAAKMGATHTEIATVLYISALEVVSSIGIKEPKSCPECNQKVYSIGSRVVDMIKKYLSENLGTVFKGYYGKRSKYLHAGELLFNYSYRGTTIPQLDPSDPTGCKVHSSIPLFNLREYTSFCLRKVLQSLV